MFSEFANAASPSNFTNKNKKVPTNCYFVGTTTDNCSCYVITISTCTNETPLPMFNSG